MSPVPVPVKESRAVEESRAQRQQRLQARFRDRGGIFVPSDKNTLIDILLARSVTGESPSKRPCSKQKQETEHLPAREQGKTKALDAEERDGEQLPRGKANGKVKSSRTSSKKSKGKEIEDNTFRGEPIAGPSRPDDSKNTKPARKGTYSDGDKGRGEVTVEEVVVVPKRKGRPPKGKSIAKTPKAGADDDTPREVLKSSVPKPRSRSAKSKQPAEADDFDSHTTVAPVKPKKTVKRRQPAAVSDDEVDGASSDYMPTTRKRAKVALHKSTINTSRKKKTPQVVQSDDSDDDSAIVIAVRKKATDIPKKSNSSKNRLVSTVDEDPPLEPKSKARPASNVKVTASLYIDDDNEVEEGLVKPERATRNARDSKSAQARPNKSSAKIVDNDAEPTNLAKSAKPPKTMATSDSKNNESTKVPVKRTTKAKTPANDSRQEDSATAPKARSKSRKRQQDEVDSEQSMPPPPVRKRAKVVQFLESDDETLVGSTESGATCQAIATRQAEKNEILTTSKSTSRKLKENTLVPKSKSASQRAKPSQPKPSQKLSRKGPPQEVINRLKAGPPPSSPHADSDTDPIDFLS